MEARKATRMRELAILVAASLALTACQLVGAGVPARVDPLAVTSQRLPNRLAEAIGARENPRVIAEYGGVYADADVEAASSATSDSRREARLTVAPSTV